MSIYHPPSKTQSVFNPSNYGGLGTGGQITTEYLDANYVSFPVAQGNTTLVGASVFGTISQQQGDFTTTGDITGETIEGSSFLVGTTNLLTEINGKLDKLTGGTNITISGDEVSCDLVGSTNIDISGSVISANGLQTALTGSTNIDISGGVISATGLQTQLTGSTNIDISGGVISATGLQTQSTGSDNIDISGGVISATGLQTALTGSTNIDISGGVISAVDLATTTDITTINRNNLIYNSDEYGIKIVSNWKSRTIPEERTWRKIVYSPELNYWIYSFQ